MSPIPFAVATLAAVAAMLSASKLGYAAAAGILKMIASCGFLLTAWQGGAFASLYGRLIFAGLIFSWFGDLFLIGNGNRVFIAGLVAFLFAHLAYIAAFTVRGISIPYASASLVVLVPTVAAVLAWLLPHVDSHMRVPVVAYTIVITSMVAAATGFLPQPRGTFAILGAILFYLSDIAVARNHFVERGFINGLIGLPLYYSAQLLLALSCLPPR